MASICNQPCLLGRLRIEDGLFVRLSMQKAVHKGALSITPRITNPLLPTLFFGSMAPPADVHVDTQVVGENSSKPSLLSTIATWWSRCLQRRFAPRFIAACANTIAAFPFLRMSGPHEGIDSPTSCVRSNVDARCKGLAAEGDSAASISRESVCSSFKPQKKSVRFCDESHRASVDSNSGTSCPVAEWFYPVCLHDDTSICHQLFELEYETRAKQVQLLSCQAYCDQYAQELDDVDDLLRNAGVPGRLLS